MGIYSFDIPGEPIPWSVWMRRSKPTLRQQALKDYQLTIQINLKGKYEIPPIKGPVILRLEFKMPLPKGVPKNPGKRNLWLKTHYPRHCDLRNLEKAAEDACQGILFLDDRQVVFSSGNKEYAEDDKPKTLIFLDVP